MYYIYWDYFRRCSEKLDQRVVCYVSDMKYFVTMKGNLYENLVFNQFVGECDSKILLVGFNRMSTFQFIRMNCSRDAQLLLSVSHCDKLWINNWF